MALTTVGSAWSAYQATRWGGVVSIALSEANAIRMQSVQQRNLANQTMAVDVGLFAQYATAVVEHRKDVADFLLQNFFGPELRKATEAWLTTEPVTNPDAPVSPFEMKDYVLSPQLEAQRLDELASQRFETARQANQHGDDYVLLTVFFASALFFTGLGTRLRTGVLRMVMTGMGALTFLVTASFLATFPIY